MTTTCPVCDELVIVKLGEIIPHLRWFQGRLAFQNSGYVTCCGSNRIVSLEK